jgi:hypothetical protein
MSGSRVSLDGLPNGYRRDRALSNDGYGRSFAVGQKPIFGGSAISVATGQDPHNNSTSVHDSNLGDAGPVWVQKQTYATVTRMSAMDHIGDMDFAVFSPLAALLYEYTS